MQEALQNPHHKKNEKQEKIECKVSSNIKAEINSNKALMCFKTIGHYIIFCHQTNDSISNIANLQGITMENMQDFIDWLLDSQSFQDQIIEHAGIFVENQKVFEKSLQKINY